jgi:F-type H+-transporting ATPase subunit b
MSFLEDPEIVLMIAFTIFVALLLYLRVHKLITKALDDRSDRIREELDEVRRLREEAQATFAEFERQHREVQSQADEIVAHAKAEAEQAAEGAKADLAASIERRLKGAEEQIAMAEANAVREVRDRAVQVAITAAAEVMASRLSDDKADALVDDAIKSVGDKLH